jgi:DNA polymerase-3 subunit delta
MIIFLYGPNTFLSRIKLKELKDRFLKEVDLSGASITAIDGETAGLEQINEAIAPVSLFSRKRMIVVSNLFLNKKENIFKDLVGYLKNKKEKSSTDDKDSNIIIFLDSLEKEEKLTKDKNSLFQFLIKEKYVIKSNHLSNTETTMWAQKEVEARGGKITRQAASLLASLLGSDLWKIDNEINKLINYKNGQKQALLLQEEETAEIQIKDIEELVKGNLDERIFALTDALSNKNKAMAVKLFKEQLDAGLADQYLLFMVTRQFKILLRIKQAMEVGQNSRQIITDLKIHPFAAQKGMAQARNFSLNVLKEIFKKLIKIDYKIKSGQGEARVMLGELIASY